jgi:organic hydroperoxide reductase OsmC/OhrA
MSESHNINVHLKLLENYVFQIDFGDFGKIITDEPEPLGDGEGPNPARMLAASIANCLAASLMFAIRKYKEEPGEVSADVELSMHRVDNRLRIERADVTINLGNTEGNIPHIDRVLAQFEDFCVVTQSVRNGFEVGVKVIDKDGKLLV